MAFLPSPSGGVVAAYRVSAPRDPSFWSFRLRLLNRCLEYCREAFLQSVPAFIIAANSS